LNSVLEFNFRRTETFSI